MASAESTGLGETRKSTSSSMSSVNKKANKQKPLGLWSGDDVLHWLRKHIGEGYYLAYGDMFRQHAITGKTLQRLNENSLGRMGMKNRQHRNELLMKVSILKLKSDIVELQASISPNSSGAT